MRAYPYHRYLTYRVMSGDQPHEVIEHLRGLEYIPPREEDVEELIDIHRRRVVTPKLRKKLGVDMFDDPTMDRVFWLVETPRARTAAERLLLDGVHPKHVATVLSLKFDHRVTSSMVEAFRDGFWDTVGLSRVDFSNYFHLGHRQLPDPPPDSVSLQERAAYAAWKEGVQPDEDELSPEAIVRGIQVDAFMRFKEASNKHSAKEALEWAKLALKTAPARKSLSDVKTGGAIPGIKSILEYPEHKVPTLGDLHSEYSEKQSGTGATSAAMGRREDDEGSQA